MNHRERARAVWAKVIDTPILASEVEALAEALAAVERETLERAIQSLKGDVLAYGAEHRGYQYAVRNLERLMPIQVTQGVEGSGQGCKSQGADGKGAAETGMEPGLPTSTQDASKAVAHDCPKVGTGFAGLLEPGDTCRLCGWKAGTSETSRGVVEGHELSKPSGTTIRSPSEQQVSSPAPGSSDPITGSKNDPITQAQTADAPPSDRERELSLQYALRCGHDECDCNNAFVAGMRAERAEKAPTAIQVAQEKASERGIRGMEVNDAYECGFEDGAEWQRNRQGLMAEKPFRGWCSKHDKVHEPCPDCSSVAPAAYQPEVSECVHGHEVANTKGMNLILALERIVRLTNDEQARSIARSALESRPETHDK